MSGSGHGRLPEQADQTPGPGGQDRQTELSGATAPHFELLAWRYHFRVRHPLFFPPHKSGNVLRGAFGAVLKRLVCTPECKDAETCPQRATCPYARIFEPRASRPGPSGLADWPRPFVFRSAHLDGRAFQPGQSFHFDVHLFESGDPPLAYFERGFAELRNEGLGPGRGRVELLRSEPLTGPDGRIVVSLMPQAQSVPVVTVRFLTPTELKAGGGLAAVPEFEALFARIRDRLSTLRMLYGPGPLEVDFRGLGERAAAVQSQIRDVRWLEVDRRSGHTGQKHPLGGFVGEIEYRGELREFLPYLRAAQWTGVGRQTVWGKGQIEVIPG